MHCIEGNWPHIRCTVFAAHLPSMPRLFLPNTVPPSDMSPRECLPSPRKFEGRPGVLVLCVQLKIFAFLYTGHSV